MARCPHSYSIVLAAAQVMASVARLEENAVVWLVSPLAAPEVWDVLVRATREPAGYAAHSRLPGGVVSYDDDSLNRAFNSVLGLALFLCRSQEFAQHRAGSGKAGAPPRTARLAGGDAADGAGQLPRCALRRRAPPRGPEPGGCAPRAARRLSGELLRALLASCPTGRR